jgi:hypothetical protein
MMNEKFENEKEIELDNSEIDVNEINDEMSELEETIEILNSDGDAEEILDDLPEGLLAGDEIDEMEIGEEDIPQEDEIAEPLVSAEENIEEPEEIAALIENRKYAELKARFEEIPAIDIAEMFADVESRYHALMLRLLSKETAADVFVELDTDTQVALIGSFTDRELGSMLEEMYLDDTVDIIEEMPAAVVKRIIRPQAATTER